MITDTQKQIYNLYLRSLAEGSDRPYKVRKNFDNLKTEYIEELKKLEAFFIKFPHFLRYEYFQAPYKIYQDEKKYYSLKFYSGYKGMQTCLAYFKSLKESDPDGQLDYLKESLKFITNFCLEKGIQLEQYPDYKSVAQKDFLIHLKQHKVSFYAAFAINSIYYQLVNLPSDEFELYFGPDVDLHDMYNRYQGSRKAKEWLEENVEKIEKYIKNNLKQQKE